MKSMEASAMLFCTKAIPVGVSSSRANRNVSVRHFNKHLQVRNRSDGTRAPILNSVGGSSNVCFPLYPLSFPTSNKRSQLLPPLKCSYSNATRPNSKNPWLKRLNNLSWHSLKGTIFPVNPMAIVKWSAVLCIAISATKWTVNLMFNPFFWMHFSCSWLFWPWFVAVTLGVYGVYCFRKHSIREANIFEQFALVTSLFTWLTLVPPAYFNGFLEGWPFVFFFVYHYFFFLNVSVRKRMYGDYYARPHDPKWDVNTPKWHRILFGVGVMVAHWLAAFEGPELHLVPGGWSNVVMWILIIATLLLQYSATVYLAKYSEKVVVPTAVVQFGPYRLVRHPIYASTMLLFVTYFIALRAPLSLLFVVAVCLLYYEQKAKLEEALMVEAFGESYVEYARRVRYKFIPLVY